MPAKEQTITSSHDYKGYLYILPAITVLASGLLIPFILSFIYSLHDWNYLQPALRRWVGMANFIGAINDLKTRQAIGITMIYTFVAVGLEMVLGVAVAVLVNSVNRCRNLFRALMLLPMLVSQVVAALAWKLLYAADYGLINHLLGQVGISPLVWLGTNNALWSVVAVEIWQNTPFVILIALAGLQSVPASVLEAAAIDGASGLRTFWSVVLPLIKPVLTIALIFRTTFALREFSLPWVLTQGGPADSTLVLGIQIYRQAFRYFSMGNASAISWLLVVITLLLSIAYIKSVGRSEV